MATILVTIVEPESGVITVEDVVGNSISFWRQPFLPGAPTKVKIVSDGVTTYHKLTDIGAIEWVP